MANPFLNAGLFDSLSAADSVRETLAESAILLRAFAAECQLQLLAEIREIAVRSPFRHMLTPGGRRMSVAMTNCGPLGWVTDGHGYRYEAVDPETGKAWPPIPDAFLQLAARAAAAAGFPHFAPDACLVNRYEPGAQMGLHQDKDERDFAAPIVSVSLGLPAVFLFGGLTRTDRPRRLLLESGDVVVWGGPSRLNYHGVAKLAAGDHPLSGPYRFNLTFRRAR